MARRQLLFDVLAIGFCHVLLSFRLYGKLSRANPLFILTHVPHEHKPEAHQALRGKHTLQLYRSLTSDQVLIPI